MTTLDVRLFGELISDGAAEITGRLPKYFSHFPVDVPERTTDLIDIGLKYLRELGATIRRNSDQPDGISLLLIQNILDAHSAAAGENDIRPANSAINGTAGHSGYSMERTNSGINYALGTRAGRTLLVISSTGVPLAIWSQLLKDRDLNRRVLIVESRCGPIVDGGTPRSSNLYDDVTDIRNVLLSESFLDVDVIAWCNGSRVAVELARDMPERIASLTLLSPTFHRTADAAKYPSQFEESLPKLRAMLNGDPNRARFLLQCLNQATSIGNISSLRSDPERRANTILRLPPCSVARDIYLPMSTVDYFENYMHRISSDQSYDIASGIAAIRCPVLLLIGTHDSAINVRAARDLFTHFGKNVVEATILGAGHHIHVLQYGYFRNIITHFTSGKTPQTSARISVSRLAG